MPTTTKKYVGMDEAFRRLPSRIRVLDQIDGIRQTVGTKDPGDAEFSTTAAVSPRNSLKRSVGGWLDSANM